MLDKIAFSAHPSRKTPQLLMTTVASFFGREILIITSLAHSFTIVSSVWMGTTIDLFCLPLSLLRIFDHVSRWPRLLPILSYRSIRIRDGARYLIFWVVPSSLFRSQISWYSFSVYFEVEARLKVFIQASGSTFRHVILTLFLPHFNESLLYI